MAEIVPAIIAEDFNDFKDKVDKVRGNASWIHIDVVDGKFAKNTSWGNPEELRDYDADAFISVHLMVNNPEEQIEAWAGSSPRRIFFHHESTNAHEEIIRVCKKNETSVGIALKVETSQDVLSRWAEEIDAVLLLGVEPGFYGSDFSDRVYAKIHQVRAQYPDMTIVVDGGMNPERAVKAVKIGADFVVVGSYIFESEDPKKALQELKNSL